MFMCFVDYKKAFDKVKWSKLWPVLIEMGTRRHLVHLIQQLYISNTATVRVNNTQSDIFVTAAGVRQGCILSPILFNIYSEHIMRGLR
ncbi:endonuclease-reverse transcriptase [Lasius niger]|uniref:Endonuclease-reverse transcriptase n=1 Tax=Lasius niger TaxID=67767 RepID=A0A0J7N1J2_LASNI|nr:endonuclease-reverse transcriptase [Lasius niger]